MSHLAVPALAILAGYLAGSIPFGYLAGRLRGVDIRHSGSGNIGATNAARVLGKRLGLVVLVLDTAKGALPVWAARAWLEPRYGAWVVAAVALAAVVGHLAPVWLRFRGGKGVATALGVFLAVAPGPALIAVIVFVVVYALTRISAAGSLAAATAFVPALWYLDGRREMIALAAALWVLIVARHHGNISRMLHRSENKV